MKFLFKISNKKLYNVIFLLFILTIAFAIRLYKIDNMVFSPLRQHSGAMLARAMYNESNNSIAKWEREVSRAQVKRLGWGEPLIMENIAFQLSKIFGQEKPHFARIFSSFFWILSSLFFFRLCTKLMDYDGAVFSLLFYLFSPFGVLVSRSFQPDGLMVSMLVIAIFFIHEYFVKLDLSSLCLAIITSCLAIYIKAPAIFFITFVFLFLSLWTWGVKETLLKPSNYIFGFIVIVLGTIHYWIGIFNNDNVLYQANTVFNPFLILKPGVLASWLGQINFVVGFIPLFFGFISLFIFQKGLLKSLSLGLFVGYIVFSIVFSYHISTHDYYSLSLIPIIGISIGPLCDIISKIIMQKIKKPFTKYCFLIFILILSSSSGLLEIAVRNFDRHGRWQSNEKKIAKEIGAMVNHSTKCVYLSISEGAPLQYYGKLAGRQVMFATEAIENFVRKKELNLDVSSDNPFNANFSPEYFIVTEFLEFSKMPSLVKFLSENYQILSQTASYTIYDLREEK